MKRIWISIAETSGARIYGLAVSLVSLFVTARVLGPEGRGMIAAATAWVTLFATFASLSLGQVAQHRVQRRGKEEWLPEMLGIFLPCTAALSALACLAAALIYIVDGESFFKGIPAAVLTLAFVMLPFMIWEEYGGNLLAAAGRLRSYNLSQLAGRSVSLAAVLLMVAVLGFGVSGALSAQALGQALVSAGGLFALWRAAGRRLQFDGGELGELLKGALRLHPNTVGSFLLASTGVLMLNHYSSKAEVGNYQLAYQMLAMLLIVPQAISMVLYSRMSAAGPDRVWPEQKRVMLQACVLMLALGVLGYFLAGPFIRVLAGPRFEQAIEIFRLLLPNLIGMTLSQLMTCQWIGRGIFALNTALTFGVALANIAANALLIPRFGLLGAIWSGWVCYGGIVVLSQVCFAWWCERRYRTSENVFDIPQSAACAKK